MLFAQTAVRCAALSTFFACSALLFTACGGDDPSDGPDAGDSDIGFGDRDFNTDNDTPTDDDTPVTQYGLDARPAQEDCRAFTAPPVSEDYEFVDKFPSVVLDTPTGMFQRPGDNTRWYVTERGGRVVWFDNDPTTSEVHVALDISENIWAQVDCSLGSLAFPPDFATTHVAYVSYCWQNPTPGLGYQTQIRYSRFTTNDGGATFDPASEELIVTYDMPFEESGPHNAPGIHSADVARFGPDGLLYLTIGDGGPQEQLGGLQAQDTNDIRGKMLRIDVSNLDLFLVDDGWVSNRARVAANIPSDNPFVVSGGLPAIYAYGFRNPWQWSFDGLTGEIWMGDVGYENWEEVNRGIVKGGNYGWGYFEGTHCTLNNWTQAECDAFSTTTTHIPPLLDYAHGSGEQQGNAVTGGVVYRGSGVPGLTGSYIFGDSSSGNIWAVSGVDTLPATPMPAKVRIGSAAPVSAFALDQNGELFATVLYGPGRIIALEPVAAAPGAPGGPPALLSQTGCFEPTDPTKPASDLVPYAVSSELWSDGAAKRRWMVVPDAEKVTVKADGDFEFPLGSVLVKEFSLAGKRIETRFLVHQEADGKWAGYSYKWNADETDATLVAADGEEVVYGAQTWLYPGRAQCSRCHTKAAGDTLGPEVAQLNHPYTYEGTGKRANQLSTLEHIGMVNASAYTVDPLPSLPSLASETASVTDKARSYLHANCAGCHREGGTTFTEPDFRYQMSFAEMNICDEVPGIGNAGVTDNPRLFAPGSPERSVIYARMHTTDPAIRMPPLARSLEHTAATDIVSEWITSTTACPP